MTKEMSIATEWTPEDWDKFSEWLKGMLQVSEGIVTFIKADGTERVMKCTLNPEQLPKVELKESKEIKNKTSDYMRVFDLDKNEWRSFTIKKVKQVKFEI